MADTRAIRVEGLADLQRAFKAADRELSRNLRKSLRKAAEPVRSDAESKAEVQISKIGIPWSRMRVGVTQKSVYVAPRKRGSRDPRYKRPNLAGRLMNEAMLPALEKNIGQVVDEMNDLLGDVERKWDQA